MTLILSQHAPHDVQSSNCTSQIKRGSVGKDDNNDGIEDIMCTPSNYMIARNGDISSTLTFFSGMSYYTWKQGKLNMAAITTLDVKKRQDYCICLGRLQLSDHVILTRQTGEQMTHWEMLNKENSNLVPVFNVSRCVFCSPVWRFCTT